MSQFEYNKFCSNPHSQEKIKLLEKGLRVNAKGNSFMYIFKDSYEPFTAKNDLHASVFLPITFVRREISKETNETILCVIGTKHHYYDVDNYFYQELNNINHPDNNDVYYWNKTKHA